MHCNENTADAAPTLYVTAGLMMERMNKVLSIDKVTKRMTIQAQATLKDLFSAADAAELSVPRSALPWWQGLTLAGVFSTASHGTGSNATSMIVRLQHKQGAALLPHCQCAVSI